MTSINDLNTQDKIELLFNNFKAFLKEKNIRYGDSALTPVKIFSKENASNSIYQRLDDKLSRISNSKGEVKKNDVVDIVGYLCLLLIDKDWLTFDEFLD